MYATLETIAKNTPKAFDNSLLYGPPSAASIEQLATYPGLNIEYQCIRKNGSILGEMVYDDSYVPVCFRDIEEYTLIKIKGKTIILDESLLTGKNDGRLRFACTHEIAHWLLHKDIYSGTGRAAALVNPNFISEENPAKSKPGFLFTCAHCKQIPKCHPGLYPGSHALPAVLYHKIISRHTLIIGHVPANFCAIKEGYEKNIKEVK